MFGNIPAVKSTGTVIKAKAFKFGISYVMTGNNRCIVECVRKRLAKAKVFYWNGLQYTHNFADHELFEEVVYFCVP